MYISLNWLKEFVDIDVNPQKKLFKNVVVGYVKSVEQHPNADKLKVAQVDIGTQKLQQIVCGGQNLTADIYVPVALPGAILRGDFQIQPVKLRGVESNGMICHLSELGLAEKGGKNISIIDKNTPGTPFAKTLKQTGLNPQELSDLLTKKTAEVEGFKLASEGLEDVVIGEVLEFAKIQNSKKLHIAQVNIGTKTIPVVFGDMVQMKKGDKVPVAIAPTTLPSGIKVTKKDLQGVTTEGMLCLDSELGITEEGVSIQYFPDTKPGTTLTTALNLNDIIFEFDNKSLTHRPDLWGHYGIAREIAALTDKKLKPYKTNLKIPKNGTAQQVEIQDTNLCPRYCSLVIENVKVQESPDWLKQRLAATDHGLYNNIVDITNYVMEEIGSPLHAFDARQITGKIIVKRAKDGEKFTDLKDNHHKLSSEMLLIADEEKNLALAGIIGGKNSMIQHDTTTVVLESANFHPSNVRKTSVQLGVRTDAVQRFEKSLDPQKADIAIKKAAELILQLCPQAKIAGPLTDINHSKPHSPTIPLSISRTSKKIGVELTAKQITSLLTKLEFQIKKKDQDNLLVTVPTFRATKDIAIEDDLVEEVARLYGYDNIPATIPALPINLPLENTPRQAEHKLRDLLSKHLGFSEALLYSFYGTTELQNCLIQEKNHIKLHNYLSADQTLLRTTLAPNLIKAIEENTKHSDQFQLYEIGRTYIEIGQFYPLEETWVAATVSSKSKSDQNFYQAKGALEQILKQFGHTLQTSKSITATPYAHPKKALTYLDHNGQTIAKVYTLHPLVSKNHNLDRHDVALFELNLSALLQLDTPEKKFQEINYLPSTTLDISVLTSQKQEIAELQTHVQKANKELITKIQLTDIYKGKNIPENKQSVTFKVTLQANHTLSDQEISQTQQQIFQNLEKIGGEIRGR